MIGDGHRLAHGGVAVHAGVFPRRDRDVGEIFAGGAEVVHMALRGKSMIGDGGKMSPGFFPMLIAVADRIARRRIGGAALARVHAQDGVRHAGFDGHDRVLHHGDRRGAAERQIGGVVRPHARHVRHPDCVTSVRVVERLVGDEAVHVGCFEAGVIEAGFDALEMQRMRRGVGPLADFGFGDADDGVLAGNIAHESSGSNWSNGVLE